MCPGLVGTELRVFQKKIQSKIFATGKCTILIGEARFIILHARFRDTVERRAKGKYGK